MGISLLHIVTSRHKVGGILDDLGVLVFPTGLRRLDLRLEILGVDITQSF